MQAKSVKGKTLNDIEEALRALPTNFKPTLAFVFLSVSQDRNAVAEMLDQFSISVIGATSNGEFIDEGYEQGTIAILLLDIDPNYFFYTVFRSQWEG